MTLLNCSAATCMYNQNHLCSRGNIEVAGETARKADETSCASFHDRSSSQVSNALSENGASEKIQINCKAESCTYNNSCKCTAAAIDITGQNACTREETRCSTFHCGCRG